MPVAVTMQEDGSITWPKHAARRMADHIHAEVRDMVANSRLTRKSEGIALIDQRELEIGKLLGMGAFSEVHEVKVVRSDIESNDANSDGTFAMKHLKVKLMSQPDNFRLAAAELAVEAHMLASFDHPNVLKIRGWASNGVASFTQGRHDSFFLLLDKLDETLDQRIRYWQEQKAQNTEETTSLVSDWWRRLTNHHPNHHQSDDHHSAADNGERAVQQQQEQRVYIEKLGVCHEIASALSYLHEHGVIFRDLKPNNIGFLNGRVQLFDFGLSRELPGHDLETPFEMSGKVGTLRYMAVEVACHQSYNVSADVYSWAMVCYEVMALQKPFAGWTRDMHSKLVCGRGVRPDVQGLAVHMRHLLQASWNQHPHRRPQMATVVQKMRLMEGEQLLQCCQPQYPVQVELPHDFMAKKPTRNPSEMTTSTLSMMSMESLTEYL